jgi:hypothetical protein
MAKLAIFIDGGYYSKLGQTHYGVRLDFPKFVKEVTDKTQAKTPEPIEVLGLIDKILGQRFIV